MSLDSLWLSSVGHYYFFKPAPQLLGISVWWSIPILRSILKFLVKIECVFDGNSDVDL